MDRPLADWLESHAAERRALRFGGRDISYGELAQQQQDCVAALAAAGVGANSCVAYLGYNSPTELALLFACARLQALFMPLNLAICAAVAPEGWDCEIIDENVTGTHTAKADVDAVGIGAMTTQAKRAYALADQYRLRGLRGIIDTVERRSRDDSGSVYLLTDAASSWAAARL